MEEFRRKVLKVDGPRVHRINHSLGVYDSYKYIRKNGWFDIGRPITEYQFYYIIRTINELLVDTLLQGHDIHLPCKMGIIEVRKCPARYTIEDNKVKTNLPIDWDRTLKLWSEDEEAFKDKTLIKMEEKEIFKVYYNKFRANFNNKSFYEFTANRDLKLRLKQKIKSGNFDAFRLW